jgi:hypothetical protein
MAINIITNDATHKCVTFTRGNQTKGYSGKSVFGAGVVAVNFQKDSTTTVLYAAGTFDLTSKVWIVTTDQDNTTRGCSIVELNLKDDQWALSTAATTVLTDPATVAATILAYFAAYK